MTRLTQMLESDAVGYEASVLFYRRFGNWRWRVTHANTKKIGASTEGYKDLAHCIDNFELLTGRDVSSAGKESDGSDVYLATRRLSPTWNIEGLPRRAAGTNY